jgi:glycosyltransferase involved in cell wall biosynthesis
MIVCVIPCFRAGRSVRDVVRAALAHVDHVILVDDACPENSGRLVMLHFAGDPRVEVLRHAKNRGVGAAMKTGMARCLEIGADYVVKIDADGQMDASYIPQMLSILQANPRLAFIKGNRFGDGSIMRTMPALRLLGNSVLTLLVRITTGYWNSIDPTNGYFIVRTPSLRRLNLERLKDGFFFEISLLCALGLRRAEIAELEIPACYGAERSNLSIGRAILTFPVGLGSSFVRRVVWQYVICDMNVGSLFLIVGSVLFLSGACLGGYWWEEALRSGIARTPGTVTLALLPLIMGFQLLLNAVLYDVQSSARVLKFSPHDEHAIENPMRHAPAALAVAAVASARRA